MVNAAHGKEECHHLTLARLCERWGVEAVLGQDPPYKKINLMTQAVNIFDTVKMVEGAVGEDVKKIPPEAQRWYYENVKAKGL